MIFIKYIYFFLFIGKYIGIFDSCCCLEIYYLFVSNLKDQLNFQLWKIEVVKHRICHYIKIRNVFFLPVIYILKYAVKHVQPFLYIEETFRKTQCNLCSFVTHVYGFENNTFTKLTKTFLPKLLAALIGRKFGLCYNCF